MGDSHIHPEEAAEVPVQSEVLSLNDHFKKTQQNPILLILCLIAVIAISYQNFPLFLQPQFPVKVGITIGIIVFSFPVLLAASCKAAATKCEGVHLYFLVDNILVALLAAFVGYAGILIIALPQGQIYVYVLVAFMNLQLFFIAGTFRILLAFCTWSKWQVLLTKLVLLLACGAYLILAAQIMINGFTIDFGIEKEQEESLKQFFFLYVFGLFTLYLEIYSKFTDLDGSGEFKHRYTIIDTDKNEKREEENDRRQDKKKNQEGQEAENKRVKTQMNLPLTNNNGQQSLQLIQN